MDSRRNLVMPRSTYKLTQEEEILGRISQLGSEQLKTQESVQELHTKQAVMEEKIKAIHSELKESIKESKEFHAVLMERLEALADNKVQIARLQEKLKTIEKLVWTALTAGIIGIVNALIQVIKGN